MLLISLQPAQQLKGEKKGTVLKKEETSPKEHKLRDKRLWDEKTSILVPT